MRWRPCVLTMTGKRSSPYFPARFGHCGGRMWACVSIFSMRAILAVLFSWRRLRRRNFAGKRASSKNEPAIGAQRPALSPQPSALAFLIWKQSFHSAFGRAGHFLLNGQEKVTTAPQERREQRSWRRSRGGQDALSQEKPPPVSRLPGILPSRFARALRRLAERTLLATRPAAGVEPGLRHCWLRRSAGRHALQRMSRFSPRPCAPANWRASCAPP